MDGLTCGHVKLYVRLYILMLVVGVDVQEPILARSLPLALTLATNTLVRVLLFRLDLADSDACCCYPESLYTIFLSPSFLYIYLFHTEEIFLLLF